MKFIENESALGKKKIFPNLDGLRFIAFLHVFIRHAFGPYLEISKTDLSHTLLGKILFGFPFGTSTFLVLSGFLITSSILREIDLKGKVDIVKFYKRRALRIWPLYFTFISCAFAAYAILKGYVNSSSMIAHNRLYYYLFLANFDVICIRELFPGKTPAFGVIWTLSVLEQFYFVWPLLFFILPKRYHFLNFVAVILGSLAFSLYSSRSSGLNGIHTLSVCIYMATGGLFAYLTLHVRNFKTFFQNLSRTNIFAVYVIGFVIVCYGGVIFSPKICDLFLRLIACCLLAFIILEQNFSERSFIKLSNVKLLTSLGKYNYGLYLFHMVALFLVHIPYRIFHFSLHHSLLTTFINAMAALVVTILLSYISYEYFEKRFIALKERYSNSNYVPVPEFNKKILVDC